MMPMHVPNPDRIDQILLVDLRVAFGIDAISAMSLFPHIRLGIW